MWYPDEAQAEYEANMNGQAEYDAEMAAMQAEADAAMADHEAEMNREKQLVIQEIEGEISHYLQLISVLEERKQRISLS